MWFFLTCLCISSKTKPNATSLRSSKSSWTRTATHKQHKQNKKQIYPWNGQHNIYPWYIYGRYTVPNRTQFFLLISVISGNLLCTLILGFIIFFSKWCQQGFVAFEYNPDMLLKWGKHLWFCLCFSLFYFLFLSVSHSFLKKAAIEKETCLKKTYIPIKLWLGNKQNS